MDTYKRRSKTGLLHNVRNSRKTQEHMFKAAAIGLGAVTIAALLSRRGKRPAGIADESLSGIRKYADNLDARHQSNIDFLAKRRQDAKQEAEDFIKQNQYYVDNPREHPAYGERIREVARDLWNAGIGRKPGAPDIPPIKEIGSFSMRQAYKRRSSQGKISFIRAFQSNDRGTVKKYIDRVHRDRIKKYGDLGRLDKEFFHLATWGTYR